MELGFNYHTAGLTLTDKELALDLATAKKDQEKAVWPIRRAPKPNDAFLRRRPTAPPPGAST
jgi:hypothetical protein